MGDTLALALDRVPNHQFWLALSDGSRLVQRDHATFRASSRYVPPLMRMPRRAADASALTTVTGVEITSAGARDDQQHQGLVERPARVKSMNQGVSTATATATRKTAGVYTAAKRSTNRWWAPGCPGLPDRFDDARQSGVGRHGGDLECQLTCFVDRAGEHGVSHGLVHGNASPVTGAWLMALLPCMTVPSKGTRSPGRMRTVLPRAICCTATTAHWPSALLNRCLLGTQVEQALMALRALSTDRASINSAMAYSAMTMAASGH